jgi:hypothetical protein
MPCRCVKLASTWVWRDRPLSLCGGWHALSVAKGVVLLLPRPSGVPPERQRLLSVRYAANSSATSLAMVAHCHSRCG